MQYLSDLVIKLEDVAKIIEFATRLVEQVQDNPELLEIYSQDINVLVEEYNMEVSLLKRELERYFEMEKRQNFPANLNLHRAYQNLRNL